MFLGKFIATKLPRETSYIYTASAVAAAEDPPRGDDPRFANDDDVWHEAQNEWHEKVPSGVSGVWLR